MKKSFLKLAGRLYYMIIFLVLWVQGGIAYGQRPRNIPDPDKSEPISLDTLPQILIYIGLPVFFVILFIWLRRRRSKNKN